MTITFTVPRKPVSVNQAYRRAGFSANRGKKGGKGFFMTSAGRDYKDSVRAHALVAARTGGWPRDLDRVKGVRAEIVVYNTRHDVGAPEKLTLDALEGVLYKNDRVVRPVMLDARKDGGKARVEVTLTLLDFYVPEGTAVFTNGQDLFLEPDR